MIKIPSFLRQYYLATPGFLLIDLIFGANVRAAAFEGHPFFKFGYYGICLGCFFAIKAKPQFASLIAMSESLFNISALIVAFVLPYYTFVGTISDGPMAAFPITIQGSINFLIAGFAGCTAFYSHNLEPRI